ncbi:MAG: trypsin-like peptidase domain-containing protein [Planctomycetes bacterium]|nr:trypsin-like peptidase domain-containing protein [Planctomycetota bacterium]
MSRKRLWLTLAIAVSLAAALVVEPFLPKVEAEQDPSRQQIEKRLKELPDSAEGFRLVAKLARPAVVHINAMRIVHVRTPEYQFDPLLRQFFDEEYLRRYYSRRFPQKGYVLKGLGSGFLVSEDGLILTNNHVINDADDITVGLADGREIPAKLLGTDPRTDVAVLKIEETSLPYLKLGDSDRIQVGDWVFAFGSPFGLDQTMTSGIVSAKGRRGMGIVDYEDFIQTDCAINPGNSGGPLVNMRGEAVGMNTAIVSRSGGYQGIGFALPANIAKKIVEQIRNKGHVVRGWLGVTAGDLTSLWRKRLKIPGTGGAYILKVAQGGPGAVGGLRENDVVLTMDGAELSNTDDFFNRIAMAPPGKIVNLNVYRDGETVPVTVTIGEQPERAH